MLTVFTTIKSFWKGLVTGICGKLFEYVPGGWITVICVAFDGYALHAAGMLGIGAISGIALCFSVLFALIASSAKVRNAVCKAITYYGVIGDVLMTATLTWFGFQAGPTAGMVALFLGLNISMFFAIIRWGYFLSRPEEKAVFEGKPAPVFKSRTRAPGLKPITLGV